MVSHQTACVVCNDSSCHAPQHEVTVPSGASPQEESSCSPVYRMDDKDEKSARDWLDTLLPKLVPCADQHAEDLQYDLSVPGDSFYLSTMYYVNIRWRSGQSPGKKAEKRLNIVVKRPTRDKLTQALVKSDVQFHNEILFYRKYAQGSEKYPRSIYLEERPPCDSVIALENVSERGYELCPWKYDVPLEYTLAAMREIGRFHGRGYVMKTRQRGAFFDIVTNIQESRYENLSEYYGFKVHVNLMSTRAVDHLRSKKYDEKFCDKMDIFLSKAYDNVMMKAVEIVEPLATLCHGDFTTNNTLFKTQDGHHQAMLIDFALLRYGSPAIDLTTFFCLCSHRQLKKPEFEVVLRVYHQALTDYLAENGILDKATYSYEAFLNEFKERGLFGFVIASFYIAVLMGYDLLTPENLIERDQGEAALECRAAGGEVVSEVLATMLLDLKELGCLDHIL